MPLSNADYAKLLQLNCDHWALRLEFCFLKTELALRAGFNPNQPRAPRGNPDGGQWTDGGGGSGADQAQLISSRPRSGGTVRIGGRLVEATPAQQARLAVSDARARDAVRRVQKIDPNWRPRPSLSEGVEGAILTNESVVREAEARLADLGLQSALPDQTSREIIQPHGQTVGVHYRRAGEEIRTVTHAEFYELLARLSVDARPIASPARVRGEWYIRPDGTVFSVRASTRHGLTIDIIRTNDPLIPSRLKVHKK